MRLFSIEIWMVLQLVIDLLWVVSIVYILRRLRARKQQETDLPEKAAGAVMDMLTPLLKEAENTAAAFDVQIREKDRLIKSLNEKLDTRIVSMNLLLNRMDAYVSSAADPIPPSVGESPAGGLSPLPEDDDINDQCHMILEYNRQGHPIDAIAEKLSIPAGEVKLVLDLKRRVADLEQNQ